MRSITSVSEGAAKRAPARRAGATQWRHYPGSRRGALAERVVALLGKAGAAGCSYAELAEAAADIAGEGGFRLLTAAVCDLRKRGYQIGRRFAYHLMAPGRDVARNGVAQRIRALLADAGAQGLTAAEMADGVYGNCGARAPGGPEAIVQTYICGLRKFGYQIKCEMRLYLHRRR
jgi:hypothetical protein